ncbi:unnamed protein product [Phytophthora fragariaefolia]|uniref:Unnamed protein product n=1 Tax=Phytophthora fragariaefolia TaxID=1490495 RepID=A0A9W6WV34_9STRA|nr:unnamed protein product [Phytophthora fragariaefolia]
MMRCTRLNFQKLFLQELCGWISDSTTVKPDGSRYQTLIRQDDDTGVVNHEVSSSSTGHFCPLHCQRPCHGLRRAVRFEWGSKSLRVLLVGGVEEIDG